MKGVWKRFQERNSQILDQLAQIEMEMANGNPRKGPATFTSAPSRPMHIVYFLLIAALACVLWFVVRHGG
jgi:hypothetical protein